MNEMQPINLDTFREQAVKKKRSFRYFLTRLENNPSKGLDKKIAELEKEKRSASEKLNNGNLPYEELQKLAVRIGEITALLEEKEMRWLEYSEFES